MTTVTIPELAARLPELLERVAAGERIPLTDGGRPVAVLGPPDPPAEPSPPQTERKSVAEIVREMLRRRDEYGLTLDVPEGMSLREFIHQGHHHGPPDTQEESS